MMTTANYIVTKDIAQRSGMIASRYRTADGRFILNERDLARVRLTPEEFVSGLAGVEMISAEVAKTLIRQGGFQMGDTLSQEDTLPPAPSNLEGESESASSNLEGEDESEVENGHHGGSEDTEGITTQGEGETPAEGEETNDTEEEA